MQHKTWTIHEIHDGEKIEVVTGATHEEALRVIRAAMYGENDPFAAATTGVAPVHELPLAA
jgi:hypothetical protein